eukprot:COSAG04_NODE_534_length_12949_cov_5.651673_6_plen_341_part_00
MAALTFLNAHGLRALAMLGIMCSGTALQSRAPLPANEKTTELLSIEVLCGASHVNSSITYIDDAQACSQLHSAITPFNTDFTCPSQIFLRRAQDHTEPPAGSPIPEYVTHPLLARCPPRAIPTAWCPSRAANADNDVGGGDIHLIFLGDTTDHIDDDPLTLFGAGGKAAMLQNEDEVRVGPVGFSCEFTPTRNAKILAPTIQQDWKFYQIQAPTTRSDPADRAPPLWPKVDHGCGSHDACFDSHIQSPVRTPAAQLDRPAGSAGSLFSTRGLVDEPISSGSGSNMFENTGTGLCRENQGGFLDSNRHFNSSRVRAGFGKPSGLLSRLWRARLGPQVWLTP